MPDAAHTAARIVEMLVAGIRRRYPYHLSLIVDQAGDLPLPEKATPIFCGCFDWHSAVHSHFALMRLLARFPDAPWAAKARQLLNAQLSGEAARTEAATLAGRPAFELPYGLAWMLALCKEARALKDAGDADAGRWLAALAPLEKLAAERLLRWAERLRYPVRSGQHDQSAFALGLILDWARGTGRAEVDARLCARARKLYLADRDAPIGYEPSAHDFLSPALGEADLLARVLAPAEFSAWLDGFIPALAGGDLGSLAVPVEPVDRADGKLAHFDGLNLSRAWMMRAIARALPGEGDTRRVRLTALAALHARTGIAALTSDHYAGTHWLGTFATLCIT